MNKATFEEYLHHPHSVKDSEKTRVLTERYPYCQTVHLLHSLSLKNSNDIEFEERLPYSAIHVSDRKVLFEHLHSNIAPEEKTTLQEEQEQQEERKEPTLPKEEESNDAHSATKAPQSAPEQDSSFVKEETDQQEEEVHDTTLERQYLSEAVSTQIFLDPENALEVPEEPQETEKTDAPEASEPSSDLEESPEITGGTTGKRSFTDWLSKVEYQKEETREEPQTLPTRREKAEFFSSAELAKESLKEDEGGMVSETLADLYAQQGNFKKAIHAFEQLRLKYPEKSSYFADCIADVKQKMKQ